MSMLPSAISTTGTYIKYQVIHIINLERIYIDPFTLVQMKYLHIMSVNILIMGRV